MDKFCTIQNQLFRQSRILQNFTSKTLPVVNFVVPSRNLPSRATHKPSKPKYKYKEPEKLKVDFNKLSWDKPLSGSIPLEQEIEELRKQTLFDFDVKSITARGFNRFQKSYNPPSDVIDKFLSICRTIIPNGTSMTEKELGTYKLNDSKLKYELLTATFIEFKHSIPNSMLYLMETTGDALKFYNTPIETATPYEALYNHPDLPPNVHIQKEPLRFHPDTDTKFGGVSAFPQSSTIVTNIRARKKFPGTKAEIRGYNYTVK